MLFNKGNNSNSNKSKQSDSENNAVAVECVSTPPSTPPLTKQTSPTSNHIRKISSSPPIVQTLTLSSPTQTSLVDSPNNYHIRDAEFLYLNSNALTNKNTIECPHPHHEHTQHQCQHRRRSSMPFRLTPEEMQGLNCKFHVHDNLAKPSRHVRNTSHGSHETSVGDGDVWVEKLCVHKQTGEVFSFFESLKTGVRKKGEPPTGASKVIYRSEGKKIEHGKASPLKDMEINSICVYDAIVQVLMKKLSKSETEKMDVIQSLNALRIKEQKMQSEIISLQKQLQESATANLSHNTSQDTDPLSFSSNSSPISPSSSPLVRKIPVTPTNSWDERVENKRIFPLKRTDTPRPKHTDLLTISAQDQHGRSLSPISSHGDENNPPSASATVVSEATDISDLTEGTIKEIKGKLVSMNQLVKQFKVNYTQAENSTAHFKEMSSRRKTLINDLQSDLNQRLKKIGNNN